MVQVANTLTSSVQAVTLTKGLHLISVTAASPMRMANAGDMMLPAIHVGVGPGVPPDSVQMLSGPRNNGDWLFEARDMLIVKVLAAQAVVLLTTLRTGAMPAISVDVMRLDRKPPAAAARRPELPVVNSSASLPRAPSRDAAVRTRIDLHIQQRGDVSYTDNFWAGALGEGLAIEAFAIYPLESIQPEDIEYSAMNEIGFQTDWFEGGRLCGSRGTATSLIGFAIRLRGDAAMSHVCEYRGSFSSGRVMGPVANGLMCQAGPGERLEAIEVSILPRAGLRPPVAGASAGPVDPPPRDDEPAPAPRQIGARFSVFRENVE